VVSGWWAGWKAPVCGGGGESQVKKRECSVGCEKLQQRRSKGVWRELLGRRTKKRMKKVRRSFGAEKKGGWRFRKVAGGRGGGGVGLA